MASNPNIVLVKVDATRNEVPGITIRGFPHVVYFKRDKSMGAVEYGGGRSVEDILRWLKDYTEYQWI